MDASAAEGLPQPCIDQSVEEPVAAPQQQTGAALVAGAAPGDGDLGGSVEPAAPPLRQRLLARGVEHLLEDPGDRENEGRLERLQVAHQVGDVGGVTESRPGPHRPDLHHAGEDVSQWEEQQRGGLVVEELVEALHRDGQLEHEVAVGEHAALGAAGGAGRVDHGGQRVGPQPGAPLGDCLLGTACAELDELLHRTLVEAPHLPERRRLSHQPARAAFGALRSRPPRPRRRSPKAPRRPGRRQRSRRAGPRLRRRTRSRSRAASTRSACETAAPPGRPPRDLPRSAPWRRRPPGRGTAPRSPPATLPGHVRSRGR